MKTNDIYLAAFPKSGITYLAYLLTAARLHHNKMTLMPNFFNIDWLAIDESKMGKHPYADIWRDGMGNFIKTHADSADAVNTIYLIREPFDTLKSYYFFRKQLNSGQTPQQFLDGPQGIKAWLSHIAAWAPQAGAASRSLYLVDYDQLVDDPREQLDNILYGLGFEYSDETIENAVRWASLPNMRLLEGHFLRHNPGYKRFNLEFVRPTDKRDVPEFGEQFRAQIDSRCASVYATVKAQLP